MEELNSENDIPNKKSEIKTHTISKSSSKHYSYSQIFLFFILANIDFNQNKIQLSSNNLFAFPVIHFL